MGCNNMNKGRKGMPSTRKEPYKDAGRTMFKLTLLNDTFDFSINAFQRYI
jgi:hypothetical protein